MRRATVLAHVTNDLRGDQVVADRQCEPAGRVVGGRARAWLCSVVWFTGPRLCGAGYKVRRVAAYEFGRVLNTSWDDDRLTPILCKRY